MVNCHCYFRFEITIGWEDKVGKFFDHKEIFGQTVPTLRVLSMTKHWIIKTNTATWDHLSLGGERFWSTLGFSQTFSIVHTHIFRGINQSISLYWISKKNSAECKLVKLDPQVFRIHVRIRKRTRNNVTFITHLVTVCNSLGNPFIQFRRCLYGHHSGPDKP